jgi:hypothetical protein
MGRAGSSHSTGGGIGGSVLLGCLSLTPGFGEGATEDTGAGDDDLGNDPMRLGKKCQWIWIGTIAE